MPRTDATALASRLDALPGIARLRRAAAEAGLAAFLVGGTVRDLLLGAQRVDLDLVVEGDPAPLLAALGGARRLHERFGTAKLDLDGHELDVATARAETYASPGALPEVRPASLADDLARRDFTVNAMAIPLAGDPALIDPLGGLDDLRAGLLRVLHERSFADDPTRALRAARYAARLGLAPEPRTLELLQGADLATVSADRREAELRRLAAEPAARRGFELLADWGLIELPGGAGELIGAVAELLRAAPWAGLAAPADAVLAASRPLEPAVRELAAATPDSPSAAVRAARGADGVSLALARALGAAWLDRYVEEWRQVRPLITGADLLAAGVPQGPAVGRGLQAALDAALDREAAQREAQLRAALEAAAGDGS